MFTRLISLSLISFSALAAAVPGPSVHCKDAGSELVADFHGADFVTDDFGYVSNVTGPVHVGWRAIGEAAYHPLDTQSYTLVLNGPTINVLLSDDANKKYLGIRLEGGLQGGKAIIADDYVDAFSSHQWPLDCGVERY